MDKLKELMARCKCGVYVSVNQHRDYYETVEQRLGYNGADEEDIAPEVRAKMAELDTAIQVQFYPKNPNGFYVVWHYDLDAALDEALACLESE